MLKEIVVQYPELNEWSQTFVGLSIKLPRLAQSVSKKLRRLGHPVFVRCHYDSTMELGDITMAASYYEDEDDPEDPANPYLEIVLIAHPDAKQRIDVTASTMEYFAISLVECLVHEYQHQHQYRKRKFLHETAYQSTETDPEKKRSQEYRGMKMEVDAFAVNIAARLWLLHGKNSASILAQGKNVKYEDSPDLYGYYDAFPEDHAVIQSLLSKIHRYLRKLDK